MPACLIFMVPTQEHSGISYCEAKVKHFMTLFHSYVNVLQVHTRDAVTEERKKAPVIQRTSTAAWPHGFIILWLMS